MLQTRNESTKEVSVWDKQGAIQEIKKIYGKDLSDGEFTTLVEIGKATNLNPFLREIWAVKYGNSAANIFIGRDGYRKRAQADADYDYHLVDAVYEKDEFKVTNGEIEHSYGLTDRGKLVGAYCNVKRKSSSKPIYVFVDIKEYSTGKSLWNPQSGKPATMIKKVAEAQALRMAFQGLFGGTYDESENWMKDKPKPKQVYEDYHQELLASSDQVDSIQSLIKEKKIGNVLVTKWLERAGVSTFQEMSSDAIDKCIKYLEEK